MTSRGAVRLGGESAVINPFADNGKANRISITVDNSYNRGKIPAFSLWAPSDRTSNPWKYMPYIPEIPIRDQSGSKLILDIDNYWVDYFRAGDEVIILDVSQLAAGTDTLLFNGLSGNDISAMTLGTDSLTIASVGVEDSGTNGTGFVKVTLTDTPSATPAEGILGTGDVLVLVAPGTTSGTDIESYQEADTFVIMEQEFEFQDSLSGVVGEGGYLVESAVYSYDGRVDQSYIKGYRNLNTEDSSPALTVCGRYANYGRFNFESIYRG
jgi:hypothetical protein